MQQEATGWPLGNLEVQGGRQLYGPRASRTFQLHNHAWVEEEGSMALPSRPPFLTPTTTCWAALSLRLAHFLVSSSLEHLQGRRQVPRACGACQ